MRWEKIKPRDKAKESGDAIFHQGREKLQGKTSSLSQGGETQRFLFFNVKIKIAIRYPNENIKKTTGHRNLQFQRVLG